MTEPRDTGILTTDAELFVQSWDPWLERVSGLREEDARGRRLTDLIPDLEQRQLLPRLRETLTNGSVQVLSPAFHGYLLPCPVKTPSSHFTVMQQRVTISPLMTEGRTVGLVIALQDVTATLDSERQLAAALRSKDEATRSAAARTVAAARVTSLESFATALADDDWKVRGMTVSALARSSDRELLDALIATLRRAHRDFNTLSSALQLLAGTHVDAIEGLSELLRDDDPDLRIQAALALGGQGSVTATAPLLEALDDENPNVRFHAIESLGRLRAESAVGPLMQIVEAGDPYLAFAALEALALINDPVVWPRLVPLLDDDQLGLAVVNAFGALGDEFAVPALVRALDGSSNTVGPIVAAIVAIAQRYDAEFHANAHVSDLVRRSISRGAAARVIEASRGATSSELADFATFLGWVQGPDARSALAELLPVVEARENAVRALMAHGQPAVEAFVDQLEHDDSAVRLAAVEALGTLGSKRAVPPLLELLDRDDESAIAVCGALARIGDRAASEPLLQLLGHRSPAVRQAAIGAVNAIGPPDLLARVERLMCDPDPALRESAVRIAGYFGYSPALVVAAAGDPVESVRAAAIEGLPFLDDPRVAQVLVDRLSDAAPKVRAAAVRALTRLDTRHAPDALMARLTDTDSWVRYFAARGLGELRVEGAVGALAATAASDGAIPARVAAIEALGAIASPAAAETLADCAAEPNSDVAIAAIRALGRLGGPTIAPCVTNAGRDARAEYRAAAVESLAAFGGPTAVDHLQWIAAGDQDDVIAAQATLALASLAAAGGEVASAAIDALIALLPDPDRRDRAATALRKLGPSALPSISKALRETPPKVRATLIGVLTRMQTTDATRVLAGALHDESASVRHAAIVALSRLGVSEFDKELHQLAAHDPAEDVRRAAAYATSVRSADESS